MNVINQLGVIQQQKLQTILNSDKKKKEKKMNIEEVLELMDVERDTYKRVGGRIRRR